MSPKVDLSYMKLSVIQPIIVILTMFWKDSKLISNICNETTLCDCGMELAVFTARSLQRLHSGQFMLSDLIFDCYAKKMNGEERS